MTREYYINDAGGQVDVLAKSAFLRYREALGEDIGAIPEGLYPGDYLKPVGEALAKEHGKKLLSMKEAEWLPLVRSFAIDRMMDMIRDDLAALEHQARRVLLGSVDDAGWHAIKFKAALDVLRKQRAGVTKANSKSRRATTTPNGKTARRRCSSRRRSATTKIARSRSPTAATRTLRATSPITTTSCSAASCT